MIKHPKKLIILGDSGVFGWGDCLYGGWAERIRLALMKNQSSNVVYPLGIRGDGLEKLAKRWKQEWSSRGELRRKVPEAILLSIGLNDTAKVGRKDGRPQLSSEAFRFGLQQMLKEMKCLTNVMMIGITPVNEERMPFADCLWYSNEAGSIYEAQIEAACLSKEIPFLPIHKSMLNQNNLNKLIGNDGIHLTSLGHEWMFNKIISWPQIKEWKET
tara:strand:- start:399 stop:1043 length:645 start_codon:yes stop_codon:yes gene_type:complete